MEDIFAVRGILLEQVYNYVCMLRECNIYNIVFQSCLHICFCYCFNRVELLFSILFFLDWIILIVQVSLGNPDVRT